MRRRSIDRTLSVASVWDITYQRVSSLSSVYYMISVYYVLWEWRKLHNEERNDLYCSPNIVRVIKSKRMIWTGHVARMGERRGVYRVLMGNPGEKRPLCRPRRRWEDNIKMDHQEVGCGSTNWIELAQDRDRWWTLVNAVMNLRVP